MVRVCLLSSMRYPRNSARMFYRMAQSLHRNGYDVTVVAPNPADEVLDGIKIRALKKAVPRWRRPLLWWTILRIALKGTYDAYQIEDPELIPVALLVRLLRRRPVLYDAMEHYPDFIKLKDYLPAWIRLPASWAVDLLERWSCRFFDAVLASDEEIALRFKGRVARLETLLNYPLSSFLDEASERVSSRPSGYGQRLIYVGGIMRDRGIWVVLEAVRLLAADWSEMQLDLVGPFAEKGLAGQVADFVEEHGLGESINTVGWVPFEQIGDYLSRADVGLIPFRPVDKFKKNIPGKVFEYMAYRLPIVASDLPPIRQFVEPAGCGILVEPGDAICLAEAIAGLLSNPGRMRQMGHAGWLAVNQRYGWQLMEPRLVAVYSDLVGGGVSADPAAPRKS